MLVSPSAWQKLSTASADSGCIGLVTANSPVAASRVEALISAGCVRLNPSGVPLSSRASTGVD